MIALAQNDPGDILAGLGARGLQGRVLERRRADEEFLCVLKMWRAGEPEYGEEAGAEAGADVGGGEAGGAGGGGGGGQGPPPLEPAPRVLASLEELYDAEGLRREDFKRAARAYIDATVPEGQPFRNLVYGEVGFMALRSFLQAHGRRPAGRAEWVFFDLGSGSGLQVFAAALLQPAFTRLVGVEIIPGLVEASRAVHRRWLERAGGRGGAEGGAGRLPEVRFECGDVLEHEGVADADVVVVNSTCFGAELMAALEHRLAQRLKPGAVAMVLSHALEGSAWDLLGEPRSAKMSWGHAEWRAYRRRAPAGGGNNAAG